MKIFATIFDEIENHKKEALFMVLSHIVFFTRNPLLLSKFEVILGAFFFIYLIITLSITINNGRSKYGFLMLAIDIIVYFAIWRNELLILFKQLNV